MSQKEETELERQSVALEYIAETLAAMLALQEEKAKEPQSLPIRPLS